MSNDAESLVKLFGYFDTIFHEMLFTSFAYF